MKYLTTPPTSEIFSSNIRVYYEDTDAGGVVFYANYLKFFERARTEWLRAMGFEQHHLVQTQGIIFVVKQLTVDYCFPARLDDLLQLTVTVERLRAASLTCVQQASRINNHHGTAPKLLARGTVTLVCVDTTRYRPKAIPKEMLSCIKETMT